MKRGLESGGGLNFFTKSVMQQCKGEHPNKIKKAGKYTANITVLILKEAVLGDIMFTGLQQNLLR